MNPTLRDRLRFPGTVYGVLRPGSRVIKTWNRPVLPDDDPAAEFTAEGIVLNQLENDEAGERWLCWFDDPRIGLDVGSPPDLFLGDETSRAHLAWWIRDTALPPCVDVERQKYMLSCQHPSYIDYCWCHEVGTRGQIIDAVTKARENKDMLLEDIFMLIKVAWCITGLEPPLPKA